MRRIFFSVLFVLLISSLNLAQSSFESTECPMTVPEGVQVDCGYLTVPEDRDLPDGNQIRLAVAILRAVNPDPQSDPIVYLEGGPGGSALLGLDLWVNTPLRDNRDIVLIDQRGTGYSEPALVCNVDDENADDTEFARQCADDLRAQGINLTAYTSRENAADIADLRQALGYDEINLYGISYGTRLALTVMRDHPEGIRSVVLDSVYPPQADGLDEQAPNAYAAFSAMFADCASNDYCNQVFPDLEARFYALLDDAYNTPIDVDGESYSDYDIIMQLFDSMYDTTVIPYLPAVIDGLANGDTSLFSQLLNGELWFDPTGYYYDEYADYYGDDYYYEGYGYGYTGGVQDLLATFDLLFMDYLGYDDFDEYLDGLSAMDYDTFRNKVIPFLRDEVSDDDTLDMMAMFLEVETIDEAIDILANLTDEEYDQLVVDFVDLLFYGDEGSYDGYTSNTDDLIYAFDMLFMDYLGYDDYEAYLDAFGAMDYDTFLDDVVPFLQETISDDDLIDLMTMYFEVETSDEAVAILEGMSDEEYDQLVVDFVDLLFYGEGYYYDDYGTDGISDDADGMFNSVECYEEVPFNSLKRAEELATGLPPRLVDAFIGDMEIFIETCAVWQVDAPDPIETSAVSSDIPTLVLSGQFDPITPPVWGAIAAENLSSAYEFVYPGAGHSVIDAGDCALQIINNFLDAPENAPDASCLDDVQFEFIVQP